MSTTTPEQAQWVSATGLDIVLPTGKVSTESDQAHIEQAIALRSAACATTGSRCRAPAADRHAAPPRPGRLGEIDGRRASGLEPPGRGEHGAESHQRDGDKRPHRYEVSGIVRMGDDGTTHGAAADEDT